MPPKKESKETAQCQVSEERAAALAVAARSFIYGREEALGPRMERTGRRTRVDEIALWLTLCYLFASRQDLESWTYLRL